MKQDIRKGLIAFSPIILMLAIYLAGSIIAGDFYKIPIAVAFLLAGIYAVGIAPGKSITEKVEHFSKGAANSRILYMVWIFVFAGAFAAVAKEIGAIDATVDLTLKYIPSRFLPAGFFLAACFISMSIGTSVGTIVALTPIVSELATSTGADPAWLTGIVVGGAFFGDNLSFISDTTIAATQTQGCEMKDKFKTNFLIILPAAIIALVLYIFQWEAVAEVSVTENIQWFKVIPYITIIAVALLGVNVLLTLIIGIAVAGSIGLLSGDISPVTILTSMGEGIEGMCELILVTMFAGGLLAIVELKGGMELLVKWLSSKVKGKRGAEGSISFLTAVANICTANNTIAILTVGPIAKELSEKYAISPKRSASLMDITSCFIQGILPYGAQLLMASGLAAISPLAIIPNLYYPILIGLMVVLTILFQWPKR
ncbi:MAG: Na+/H+ antiporter NhaC family protein [Bacteroidales bacterium]|nr:Na+/H+ antiporter NhaC family protein [Bacteroidales bacterium]MBO7764337.1 Na+/H+ antiporter NhaC family protein [Bacteroidales bacterium]